MADDLPPDPAAAKAALAATRLTSPFGEVVAAVDPAGRLVYLDFSRKTGPTPAPGPTTWRDQAVTWVDTPTSAGAPTDADGPLAALATQLAEYFAGTRRDFDLPLAPQGEAYYQTVWAQLLRIPYGETISYGELARRIGQPGAARAVGRANGHNPIAILIPCHRVIGADGRLTGYSGGIERKAALLALEQATTPAGQATLPLGLGRGSTRRGPNS